MGDCARRPEGTKLIQGFFTDDFFSRGVVATNPAGYTITWAIQPEETEIASLKAFVLDDGRIAAQIAPIHNPAELIIFVQHDGHWLIDELYVIVDQYNFGPMG